MPRPSGQCRFQAEYGTDFCRRTCCRPHSRCRRPGARHGVLPWCQEAEHCCAVPGPFLLPHRACGHWYSPHYTAEADGQSPFPVSSAHRRGSTQCEARSSRYHGLFPGNRSSSYLRFSNGVRGTVPLSHRLFRWYKDRPRCQVSVERSTISGVKGTVPVSPLRCQRNRPPDNFCRGGRCRGDSRRHNQGGGRHRRRGRGVRSGGRGHCLLREE